MRESLPAGRDGSGGREPEYPRAVIHKRILSIAESRPNASMESIAADVSGATTSFVEQVLEEYGDPGGADATVASEPREDATVTQNADVDISADTEDRDPPGENEDIPMHDHDGNSTEPALEPADLTEKQRETLLEIRDRPDATQAELAETLGVSSATINQRVNGIESFDWANRRWFVERLFDSSENAPESMGDDPVSRAETATDASSDGTDDCGADRDACATAEPSAGDSSASARSEPEVRTDGLSDSGRLESGGDVSREFVEDGEPSDRGGDQADSPSNANERSYEFLDRRISELNTRIESLERRLTFDRSKSALTDPELTHKVVHACLDSEQISETEELRILQRLLTPARDGDATGSTER